MTVLKTVSVIATVRNESAGIRQMLLGLAAQTAHPLELVIVDGGSTDSTVALIDELAPALPFAVRTIVVPGANVAAGRNRAIELARGSIIAVTDAGCRAERDWLGQITAPLLAGSADVVGGFYAAECHTAFERWSTVFTHPHLSEINPDTFQPSSRSIAFTKQAWAAAGGYPEWLVTAEDTWFDLALARAGMLVTFVPAAVVSWRPRTTLRGLLKQFYRYSLGDGRARILPLYYAKALLLLAVLGLSAAYSFRTAWLSGVSLLLLTAYGAFLSRKYLRRFSRLGATDVVALCSLGLLTDMARLAGLVAGLVVGPGKGLQP